MDRLAVCVVTENNNKREQNKWFHLTTMRKIHRSHWVRCAMCNRYLIIIISSDRVYAMLHIAHVASIHAFQDSFKLISIWKYFKVSNGRKEQMLDAIHIRSYYFLFLSDCNSFKQKYLLKNLLLTLGPKK